MGHSLVSSLVIGSLAWYAAALPQPQSSTAPSSTTSSDMVYYTPGAGSGGGTMSMEETARKQNDNHCLIYTPTSSGPGVVEQCGAICGKQAADAAAQGHIGSISCISFNPNPDDTSNIMQLRGPGGPYTATGGNCTCNEQFLDDAAEIFMEALPIIANVLKPNLKVRGINADIIPQIGCELIMNSLQAVAEIGALAIPGVGEAIDAGMTASIQAVKLAKYSFDATKDGVDAVQSWLDPCGPSQLPQGLQTVFDVLGSADDKVVPKGGFKPPKGLKKGGGKGN